MRATPLNPTMGIARLTWLLFTDNCLNHPVPFDSATPLRPAACNFSGGESFRFESVATLMPRQLDRTYWYSSNATQTRSISMPAPGDSLRDASYFGKSVLLVRISIAAGQWRSARPYPPFPPRPSPSHPGNVLGQPPQNVGTLTHPPRRLRVKLG